MMSEKSSLYLMVDTAKSLVFKTTESAENKKINLTHVFNPINDLETANESIIAKKLKIHQ